MATTLNTVQLTIIGYIHPVPAATYAPLTIFDGRTTLIGNGLEVEIRFGVGRGGVAGRYQDSPT